jgi:hypothetical protein
MGQQSPQNVLRPFWPPKASSFGPLPPEGRPSSMPIPDGRGDDIVAAVETAMIDKLDH